MFGSYKYGCCKDLCGIVEVSPVCRQEGPFLFSGKENNKREWQLMH